MTEPTKSLCDQIADLIDENAEVRGEHYNDHAILINADELAANIVELLSLSAPPALENGPANLADATNDPADLSSLRKGAEVMREAIEDAVEKLNTYRGAAVQTVIDQLAAALVSGSREDGDG